MGVKTAFMLKWQCSAIIVSSVQLSHKLYNDGDGLIKLPYNVPFFSAFKLFARSCLILRTRRALGTTNYPQITVSSGKVEFTILIYIFCLFLLFLSHWNNNECKVKKNMEKSFRNSRSFPCVFFFFLDLCSRYLGCNSISKSKQNMMVYIWL